jgi:HAD superfamily phosphatase (TIGR01668 family)
MSRFRAGRIDRSKLGFSRHFAPVSTVCAITDVQIADLLETGKRLVLLDVDNTLVGWHSHDIPVSTFQWISEAKSAGLHLCILSNTRNPARLQKLAAQMDIPYLRGRFKPSRRMYWNALEKFGVAREEAVMIGDQLFTDVLGANRAGIDAIWVEQMTPRDFIGTKASRLGERFLRGFLHRAMIVESEVEVAVAKASTGGVLTHPTIQQFTRFAVVGGTATVVDMGIAWILEFHVRSHGVLWSQSLGTWLTANLPVIFGRYETRPADASVLIFKSISTTTAAFLSFALNRRWTFQIRGKQNRAAQARRFVIVTLVGMLLNIGLTTLLNHVLPGSDKARLLGAMMIATVLVAFWNFFAQKHWAFRADQ